MCVCVLSDYTLFGSNAVLERHGLERLLEHDAGGGDGVRAMIAHGPTGDVGELEAVAGGARLPREHERELDVLVGVLVGHRPVEQGDGQRRVRVVVRQHGRELVTRERDVLTGQLVDRPRLRVERMVGAALGRQPGVPRGEAGRARPTRAQRLLIGGRACGRAANRDGEHVVRDELVFVDAGHELVASEVARVRAADGAGADAADRSAVRLTQLDRLQEVHVWLHLLAGALAVIPPVS